MLVTSLVVSIILCVMLLVLLILCYIKYRRIVREYNIEKSDWLYTKNRFSLIESKYRAYVEEKINPFTIMRDIGEIIYAGCMPSHNDEEK